MAEFLTMQEAEDKFGKKGRTKRRSDSLVLSEQHLELSQVTTTAVDAVAATVY